MTTATSSAWIADTPDGVVIAREHDGELLVDRPARHRFRDPTPLRLHNGRPVVDGTALYPIAGLPSIMEGASGWYAGGGRRILLTQLAEAYFGEPMILLLESGRIQRAYGLDETRLLADDGTMIFLGAGRVQLLAEGGSLTLHRLYDEERVSFPAELASGRAQLGGTLVRPRTPGPHPAAVVLHGAAFGQRDSCRLQAGPLLDAGLAVLIYDKPGHGQSTGPTDPSIYDQADVADAGLSLLAAHPDIDPGRIGLAGFSNGMWSAPLAGARRGDVAFVVGLGSPGVSMAESEVHRRTKLLREAGVGASSVEAAGEAWRRIFHLVGTGPDADTTTALAAALSQLELAEDLDRYQVPEFARRNPMLSPIPPLIPAADLAATVTAEVDPQLTYDPTADYARLTCPVLLQYGAEDTSVPVVESVRAISSARPVTVIVYPGLEHMLNEIPTDVVGLTGEEAMYQFHDFHFGPTVFADLIGWLRANVVTR